MATVLTADEEEAAARAERVKLLASFYADDLARHDVEVIAAIVRELIARIPVPARKAVLQRAAADMLTFERESKPPTRTMKITDRWVME